MTIQIKDKINVFAQKITLLITKELDSIAREVIKNELKMIDPTSFTTKTDYPIELEMNTDT